jgi:hypothetical protein
MFHVGFESVRPHNLHRAQFGVVQFEFGEDYATLTMGEHKVRESLTIGAPHTGSYLVRAGMVYQPAVH